MRRPRVALRIAGLLALLLVRATDASAGRRPDGADDDEEEEDEEFQQKRARGRTADRFRRRAEERRAMLDENLAELRRRHLEVHGRELKDEELRAAIDRARERAPPRFGEGWKPRLSSNIPGLEEYYEEPPASPVADRMLQVGLQDDDKNIIIVSALSPGWPWNYGRNEWYCVAITDIAPPYLPAKKSPLSLVDCLVAPAALISLKYTEDFELVFNQIDNVYWDWCAETSNLRKGKIRVNNCDIQEPLQQWLLFDADNSDGTWRPNDDAFQCVTARPPSAGKTGGGRLKLRRCTVKGVTRMAQTYLACEDTSSCKIVDSTINPQIDTIDCDITDDCSTQISA